MSQLTTALPSASRSGAMASTGRALALAGVVSLPVLGLALLMSDSDLDQHWQHHPAHFWMVLAAGVVNAGIAYATGVAAHRRGDSRVLLVSMAFLAAAGFLGLHALATPGVLLDGPNPGFAIATPVGLVIAGALLAISTVTLAPRPAALLVRRSGRFSAAVLGLVGAWAAISLLRLPPLDDPTAPEHASGIFVVLAVIGVALYAVAVYRYLRLHRRRPAPMLLSMAVASALLAEAMVAVAVGRNWHASWWEWHLLMLVAFGLVAWSAHRQWHEERFSSLYLKNTAGATREVSVLFADLQGFTSFSERHDPQEVSAMLNAYFEVVIPPIVQRLGGSIDRIIGDALMVVFNQRGDQPDHAERAVRAGLAIQEATAAVVAEHPSWPRFRVGVNSGPAFVGLLGTAGGRTFTAIGDAVNLAARLEGLAPVGGVALGPDTVDQVADLETEPLGRVTVKGREEAVDVHRLVGISGG
jgi:adenylate cyclase